MKKQHIKSLENIDQISIDIRWLWGLARTREYLSILSGTCCHVPFVVLSTRIVRPKHLESSFCCFWGLFSSREGPVSSGVSVRVHKLPCSSHTHISHNRYVVRTHTLLFLYIPLNSDQYCAFFSPFCLGGYCFGYWKHEAPFRFPGSFRANRCIAIDVGNRFPRWLKTFIKSLLAKGLWWNEYDNIVF